MQRSSPPKYQEIVFPYPISSSATEGDPYLRLLQGPIAPFIYSSLDKNNLIFAEEAICNPVSVFDSRVSGSKNFEKL